MRSTVATLELVKTFNFFLFFVRFGKHHMCDKLFDYAMIDITLLLQNKGQINT